MAKLSFRRTYVRAPEGGFSLVELLLTIALLILLLGSIAFNFSALQKGASLEEGSTRFVTLLRYARSHAAYTGRAVQLQLAPSSDGAESIGGFEPARRSFVLQWEPDPLSAPGQFAPLRLSSWDVDQLNELVAVAALEVPRPLMGRMMPTRAVASGVVVEESIEGTALDQDPVLTFYADGASDTARIVLVSRDGEDSRRFEIHLEGLTGTVESAWLEPSLDNDVESMAATDDSSTETSP